MRRLLLFSFHFLTRESARCTTTRGCAKGDNAGPKQVGRTMNATTQKKRQVNHNWEAAGKGETQLRPAALTESACCRDESEKQRRIWRRAAGGGVCVCVCVCPSENPAKAVAGWPQDGSEGRVVDCWRLAMDDLTAYSKPRVAGAAGRSGTATQLFDWGSYLGECAIVLLLVVGAKFLLKVQPSTSG